MKHPYVGLCYNHCSMSHLQNRLKQIQLRPLILLITISLLLTGCALFPKQFKEVIADYKPSHEYYMPELIVQTVSQPTYVKEKVVYRVDSEMELAVLAMILFEEGTVQIFIEDRDFSIDRTYAYLESLMIHAFRFSMGTKTYTQNDKTVKTLDYVKIELYDDRMDQVDKAIDTFIKLKVDRTETPERVLRDIHDGLIVTTQYDTAILELDLTNIVDHTPFEAYGLFIQHKAVCSGYSKAFVGVAREMNIPVLTVSSTKMNHAWNLVYVNDAWLYIDVTFDDPVPDKANHVVDTYFLLTHDKITRASFTIKAHEFDLASDTTLTAAQYLEFAQYVFN
ncbi:MAG: transglutaminase domain-containing protein [Erysipelotrichaceae bacterium]|nr:MAG: transglutaminase domain-containing [Erysipelotrichaceae bacterium]TXT18891.1 MAG: transglutaminase domain-containing protein [Erysipelotrichaceae bacterium]